MLVAFWSELEVQLLLTSEFAHHVQLLIWYMQIEKDYLPCYKRFGTGGVSEACSPF